MPDAWRLCNGQGKDYEGLPAASTLCGVYGYPLEEALAVAVDTIEEWLRDHDMAVMLCLFGDAVWQMAKDKYPLLIDC